MHIFPRSRPVRRAVAALVLVVTLPACYSWRYRDFVTQWPEESSYLRLTLVDGTKVELWAAALTGDSIVGKVGRGRSAVRRAAAIDDVRLVESRYLNAAKTTGAAFLILLPIAALVAVATFDVCTVGC